MKIIGVIFFVLLMAGCQTAPVNLNLLHTHNIPDNFHRNTQCDIKLLAIKDVRSNRETLGVAGGAPVLAKNVAEWVRQGVMSGLSQRGYNVSAQQSNLSMQVNVKLAYLRPLPLRLHATVALEVFLKQHEKQIYHHTFRAIGDKNNWANGEGEIMEVLNVALNNVVVDMAESIQPSCFRASLRTSSINRNFLSEKSPDLYGVASQY